MIYRRRLHSYLDKCITPEACNSVPGPRLVCATHDYGPNSLSLGNKDQYHSLLRFLCKINTID